MSCDRKPDDPRMLPEWEEAAIAAATGSTCSKSRRGAVLFLGDLLIREAANGPPPGFLCDGSEICRGSCNKVAVHAEERLLINQCPVPSSDYDLIHAKVDVEGLLCISGPPSCWQCSRAILDAGIARVWLYHESGWTWYGATAFHRLTLEHCDLPVILDAK